MGWYGHKKYVPVAKRREKANKEMDKLRKKGIEIQPVTIQGMKIAKNFWGKAWCEHLEGFGDYSNRLPRGRTYVRNGSVCHLDIKKGEIEALVRGTSLYEVEISIQTLPSAKWKAIKSSCSGKINSLLSLLQGKIPDEVLQTVTNQKEGLFPSPKEIRYTCSCPDYASMCKHIAAVIYGIGARLDHNPELLFTLRGVDHEELISAEVDLTAATQAQNPSRNRISLDALGDVFGIDLGDAEEDAELKPAQLSSPKKTQKVKNKAEPAPEPESFTGPDVTALRKKFEMTQTEFSLLLGVGTFTVDRWEKSRGALNLKPVSLQKLRAIWKLTKIRAWKELREQSGM